MSLEILPLEEKHINDAAALTCARYLMLRKQVPLLPARYEEVSTVLPMLGDLVGQAPGVVAVRSSRLVGFLSGFVLPSFMGKRSVYSPEWANAAEIQDSRRIYEEMYAHLSARWVDDGCFTHLVGLLADDREGLEGWHWLGFGLIAADGIRDLQPVTGPTLGADIRQAGPEDVEQVSALIAALRRHLAAAPSFFPHSEEEVRHDEEWLGSPANAMWLACRGMEVVACMGQGPANPDACTIILDEGTTSIVSAFTIESARGSGIATALLNRCLDWARTQGYERCAVDWEPMNILASRFWLKHFQPVSYALVRYVDERVAPGHA